MKGILRIDNEVILKYDAFRWRIITKRLVIESRYTYSYRHNALRAAKKVAKLYNISIIYSLKY